MARSTLPTTAVAVSMALLTTGEHAVAQGASELEMRLQAGAARSSRTSAAIAPGAMALTPAVRYSDQRFSLETRGTAWLDNNRWLLGDAMMSGAAHSSTTHGIRAEFLANASRIAIDPVYRSQQVDATARLHVLRDNGGAWVGAGLVKPLRIATVSNVNVSSGGLWTKLGPATLRASVTNFFFTRVATNDSVDGGPGTVTACPELLAAASAPSASGASCRRESRLTDLEGGIKWEHRVFEVSVNGGQRFGEQLDITPESRTWGAVHTTLWLTNQIAAVAGSGREPAQPTRGLPARTFASFGVMLAYWPIPRGTVPVESPSSRVRAFELRPAGVGLQRLTMRIGGVESVEIMGDFTDWAPVQLVRRGRDHWELLIPMSPGVHHINMRIDGSKWASPPGIPSTRDDFSGEVGVLVIKN